MDLWNQYPSWEDAEVAWEKQKSQAEKTHPLKVLKNPPKMVGITPDAASFLKGKSLVWMIKKDKGFHILKQVLKHPWRHFKAYVKSLLSKNSFLRKGDFFLYGIDSFEAFETLLKKEDTLLVLGFSYCHKPFECPSGRFSDQCVHDLQNPVCQQCFIGKCVHAASEKNTVSVYIPTIHYIGRKIFELIETHKDKQVIFLITACEMTLTMFADWGNMAGVQGIGVRLDGRICNTMKAFELSEEGIKPGLTVVLEPTKAKCLEWLRLRKYSKLSA
jgi:hypothetical protein